MRTMPSGRSGQGWASSTLWARLDVKSVKLQARVGIATGLVVVGDLIGEGSAQEQSVVGETPNLAARLQALAEPGAVVIAAGTRRLVGDLFEYRDLGAVEVEGHRRTVPAWQVLRPSAVASRFEALHVGASAADRPRRGDRTAAAPVGAAQGRHGQVVLVSGEAGDREIATDCGIPERIRSEPHIRLRYFCSPLSSRQRSVPISLGNLNEPRVRARRHVCREAR